MRKLLLFTILLLLAGKYTEITKNLMNYYTNLIVMTLIIIGTFFILIIGLKFLEKKWRFSTVILGILGIITVIIWYFYPNPLIHFLWNIFIFTAFFIGFYKIAHYEIKKFPAFSYSFMIIYILTESISIWRNDIYIPFFLIYLTFILLLYIIGIKKIKY